MIALYGDIAELKRVWWELNSAVFRDFGRILLTHRLDRSNPNDPTASARNRQQAGVWRVSSHRIDINGAAIFYDGKAGLQFRVFQLACSAAVTS